jgi:hypothetical protein
MVSRPNGIWIGAVGPKILDLTGILGDDKARPLQRYPPTNKLKIM